MSQLSFRKHIGAYLIIGALVALAIGGCGGGGGSSSNNTTPTLTVSTPSKVELSAAGGSITLNISTSTGVTGVTATIAKNGGTPIALTLKTGTTYPYQATYPLVANSSQDGNADTYSIVINAVDPSGVAMTPKTLAFIVDAPLLIKNEKVDPTIVANGTATISADIIGGSSTKQVKAHITLNNVDQPTETMLPTSGTTYTLVKSGLKNTTNTDMIYKVYVEATDSFGQTRKSTTLTYKVFSIPDFPPMPL